MQKVISKPLGWQFYIIANKATKMNCTYAGVSPDPHRRLRQHNSEIKGGAVYTTSKPPSWIHVCLVSGFQDKIQALQFEWAVKHVPPRNAGGLLNRLQKLNTVLNKETWTSKAPLACNIELHVKWLINPPLELQFPLPSYVTQEYAFDEPSSSKPMVGVTQMPHHPPIEWEGWLQ